ncbi:Adenine-specific methyltransferase EcoRI [Butyrivibrio proteoclasticus]|uniref:Adenine-specific methyltransferase EcoRI n=1 Tax=Butyrivibrio proteoclasticus TaxID=43305 RepID=A0A1I5XWD1_9FIRM|nr:adenine-specific methyltransferase EcoRI family protein [Butyrivibrio proteoclasticus]SFQ36263.1 Adenine-specific methyltransferase EcoRI [Butyrivibrio proteoclasticus]
MLYVGDIKNCQVTLVSELNNAEVVDFQEVRRRLASNIEIDGLSLNDNADIVDREGNILDKAQYKVHTKNSNLSKAKAEKNDEFYTRLEDIEAELSHYPKEYFKDKVIYCPTDVAVNTGRIMQSQFVRYFQINAHRLQFKKLIATCLVYKAAGEDDSDLEHVQNCYVLERKEASKQQKMVWSKDANNPVVEEYEEPGLGMQYRNADGSNHFMPYHIVNQAVTAPEGKYKIVKRYIDHYDEETGKPCLCEEDKGLKWEFHGHLLSIKWCRKHPDGTIEMLPEECYYDNTTKKGEDFLTDFSVFPKDENGNPCFEDLDSAEDKGSVCLYPPEYYDYQEIDYTEYDEYFEHCPEDSDYVSGDYRSAYCQKLFKEADVVVTNPPFSLFRDFVTMLESYNLDYCIVGNQNAITYKEIFPLIKEGKLWMGTGKSYSSLAGYFSSTYDDVAVSGQHKEGSIRVSGVCWFTNIDHFRLHEPILLVKTYNPNDYPKYDNYDAIEVKKTKDIPCDYDGIMGVPISFLHKYSPDQFEILGSQRWCKSPELVAVYCGKKATCEDDHKTLINGKETYDRIFIRRKQK